MAEFEGKKGKDECDVISLKLKFKRAEKNIYFTLNQDQKVMFL